MAHVADLWITTAKDEEGNAVKKRTKRYGKGKRWLARWVDDKGEDQSRAFEKKVDAEIHAKKMEVDVKQGEYYDPNAGKARFAEFGERWFQSRVVDPSSFIHYTSVYRLHVEPEFGKRQVNSIKPSTVQAWLGTLAQTLGASTIITAFHITQGILDLAVADEAIKKNPARSPIVQAPKWIGQKVVPWTDESVFAMIDTHEEFVRLIPILGVGCGLRQGEIFGVALEDFDFSDKTLRVRRQVKRLGNDHIFALPKSDKERVVPLPDWVSQAVQVHRTKFKPRPMTLPWEKSAGKLTTHNLLFRWPDDGVMRARLYNELVWRPGLVKIGLAPEPTLDSRGRKRYANDRRDGMHALRHYYASVLLADGVSIKELAEYLGHGDPGFTLRTYIHMLPDSHERAINAIDARLLRPRLVA